MHFFFHRILFESIFLFRSIRVPARWAMIAILGASLLAAIGARKISDALQSRQRQIPSAAIYAVVCCLFLAEVWVAPIGLWRGEVDPDPVTKYLAQTSMRGGIAHLPSGTPGINQRYVLRQADHLKPLITAFSGFVTPQLKEYETLSQQRPISDRFFDLLEQIPASYLVVHDSTISPDARAATREMLIRGVTIGRLRFIREFEGTGINGNDGAQLFAVSKIEPAAQSEGPTPFYLQIHDLGAEVKNDPTLLVSAFDNWDFPLYLLYKLSYGRMPRYEEFMPDAETTGRDTLLFRANWHQHLRDNLRAFSEAWTNRPAFRKIYVAKSNAEFVNQLYANVSITPDEAERDSLVTGLNQGSETKASVLFKLTGNTALRNQERNKALVLAYYFGYLRRNPDDPPDNNLAGFNFWQEELDKSGDPARVTRAFMLSGEYEGIKRKGSK
ncbi:MAG TPA: hypothetical protein VJT50_02380, partial [Pyrinomonadaceae bacterium]|nr:hypothetical protein [Pyrinomonadaceae bacterium]